MRRPREKMALEIWAICWNGAINIMVIDSYSSIYEYLGRAIWLVMERQGVRRIKNPKNSKEIWALIDASSKENPR